MTFFIVNDSCVTTYLKITLNDDGLSTNPENFYSAQLKKKVKNDKTVLVLHIYQTLCKVLDIPFIIAILQI